MEKRIFSFLEWLSLNESSAARPASKSGLYPLGYGGIGNYPAAHWLPAAADAILYVTMDDRLFDNGVSAPWSIEHLPGPTPEANPNSGTGGLFSIDHIPGPKPYLNFNKAGEGAPFSIQHLK